MPRPHVARLPDGLDPESYRNRQRNPIQAGSNKHLRRRFVSGDGQLNVLGIFRDVDTHPGLSVQPHMTYRSVR